MAVSAAARHHALDGNSERRDLCGCPSIAFQSIAVFGGREPGCSVPTGNQNTRPCAGATALADLPLRGVDVGGERNYHTGVFAGARSRNRRALDRL